MPKAKVELNFAGFDEYRKSPEVEKMLRDIAKDAAQRSGTGAKVTVKKKGSRAVAKIKTEPHNGDRIIKALLSNGGTVKMSDD